LAHLRSPGKGANKSRGIASLLTFPRSEETGSSAAGTLSLLSRRREGRGRGTVRSADGTPDKTDEDCHCDDNPRSGAFAPPYQFVSPTVIRIGDTASGNA